MAPGISKLFQYQTKAVYWALSSANTGAGQRSYSDPVSLLVRWENGERVLRNNDGSEIQIVARAWVPSAVTADGYLWLGDIDSLSSSERAEPESVEDARVIRRITEISNLTGTRTERVAYLGG